MEQQTIIFLGAQGSGKGTQVALLEQSLQSHDPGRKTVYFEAGEELRKFGEEEGAAQKRVGESLARGELQPSFLSGYLMARVFLSSLGGNEHLLVDGFPRSLANYMDFDSAVKFYDRKDPVLLHLVISDKEAVVRLMKRGRADDTEEGIRERLSWTHEQVNPIIEKFRSDSRYRLFDIDGERTAEDIHRDILGKLEL